MGACRIRNEKPGAVLLFKKFHCCNNTLLFVKTVIVIAGKNCVYAILSGYDYDYDFYKF